MLLLAGCNPSRDSADEWVETSLDVVLAQRKALSSDRPHSQERYDTVMRQLAEYGDVTKDQFTALSARVTEDTVEYDGLRRVMVAGSGGMAGAATFLRAVLALSKQVAVLELKLSDDDWSARLNLSFPRAAPPAVLPSLSSANAWCYSSCRERRQRISAKLVELVALEASLGPLATLPSRETQLAQLLPTRGFATTDMALTLDRFGWVPAHVIVHFENTSLHVMATRDLVDACSKAFTGLGTCRFNEPLAAIEVQLP